MLKEEEIMYNNNNNQSSSSSCLDIQPYTPPPTTTVRVETTRRSPPPPPVPPPILVDYTHQQPNPRKKKRTKLSRLDNNPSTSGVIKPPAKYVKKPDPSAPKITRPCTECGKKFWSWKALFGHMRCHPERQWRGINPPPNLRRSMVIHDHDNLDTKMTQEDHEVASCLLMLANGLASTPLYDQSPSITTTVVTQGTLETSDHVSGDTGEVGGGPSSAISRFECSSCNKVFGSRQALGGHRASHKNVRGCFAITKNVQEEDRTGNDDRHYQDQDGEMVILLGGHHHHHHHQCSICLRVFSSGQALGGHKRCHWEKVDELNIQGTSSSLDLNLPAPAPAPAPTDDHSSSCLSLDLKLGL